VDELQRHLGRSLTQTELAKVVQTAQEIGTVDAADAYASSSGRGENLQPSERQASHREVAEAIGAPSVSDDEGRIKLTAQIAEDVQAEQEAEAEGGEE
jgi:hypothetical protein